MTLFTTSRLALLGLSLSLAAPALAQTQAPPAAEANPARGTQHLTQEQMMQRVEAYLARLRSQLGVTPEQEPQWHAFADIHRDNAIALRRRLEERATRRTAMNAADNMTDQARVAEQLAQERQRLATAFRALYDAMSPTQQQQADVVFRAPGPAPARPASRPR